METYEAIINEFWPKLIILDEENPFEINDGNYPIHFVIQDNLDDRLILNGAFLKYFSSLIKEKIENDEHEIVLENFSPNQINNFFQNYFRGKTVNGEIKNFLSMK